MKKYRARIHRRWDSDARIEEVDVERETEASIWINGQRSAKRSEWSNYYDTWEDAKSALLAAQQRRVEQLRSQLQVANSRLGNINGMHQE